MDNYCSSCGAPIPDGQGKSCSMCYGDVAYGKDGYYQDWVDRQIENEMIEKAERIYEENLQRSIEHMYEEQEKHDIHNRIVNDF